MLKAPDSAQHFETAKNKILRHFDVTVMKCNDLHSVLAATSIEFMYVSSISNHYGDVWYL